MSPTITTPAMTTGVGMILGTAAYMSPGAGARQDRGQARRHLGVRLRAVRDADGHAGVRGRGRHRHARRRSSAAEPDWSALPAERPPASPSAAARGVCRRIAKAAHARHRRRAPRAGGRVRDGAPEDVPTAVATQSAAAQRPLWRRAIPVVAAAVVASAMVGAAVWTLRPPAPSSPVTRFALALGEGQQFTSVEQPDAGRLPGRHAARVRGQQPVVPAVDVGPRGEAHPRHTTDAERRIAPVFSPDGQSIAFYSAGGPSGQEDRRQRRSGGHDLSGRR